MQDFVHKTTCRVCGESDLVKVLDLGVMPPANAYLAPEDLQKPEKTFPLVLYFCRTCSLAQLLDVVNPEILFKDYHYVTGANAPLVAHFKRYAKDVILPRIRSPHDLVVDIGGNDGVLLSFVKDSARVLNVDPADNLRSLSEEKGVPFYSSFFSASVAEDIVKKYGNAKVVVANNVFAHTDPLQNVLRGVETLIGADGAFVFEVHWVKHLIEEGAFDQMYHEHLCYFSVHAINYLVEACGMQIVDVEIVPMQGKSLRVQVGKNGAPSANVARILAEEKAAGLTNEATYHAFARSAQENKEKLLTMLKEIKAAGKKIVGYGAPAKGNTLLNYYGLGRQTLEYLTDTTPQKQGLYSPGMHIPIVAPEKLLTDTPDYILLLAWNYKNAILEKEKALRERGVKFIVTIPRVEIV